jgi:pteridine reductase
MPTDSHHQTPPVALVTGAAKRVGAEIARTLHEAGANLVLHCHTARDQAEALANTLNARRSGSTLCLSTDLREPAHSADLIAHAIKHFGRLDALINNASSFYATPIGSIDETIWHDLIGSNLKGPLFLAQAAAPHLKRSQGCLINITDIHADYPLRHYALYCTAKAGLAGLTRALALELAPEVRVNAIAPGPIAWPEGAAAADFDLKTQDEIVSRTPLLRQGQPSDIARTVRFLLFDAPYITGQVIPVDGGRSLCL